MRCVKGLQCDVRRNDGLLFLLSTSVTHVWLVIVPVFHTGRVGLGTFVLFKIIELM